MYLRNSGFAPRRRQGGFIQGAILFALVIIAVVVAAFSLANRDSQTNADSEQARVNSTYAIKVGNDLQTGINRALGDGLDPTAYASATPDDDFLFSNTLKYMTRPQFPDSALAVANTQPTYAWDTARAVTGVGDGTKSDAIMTVTGLKDEVCTRINVAINKTLVTEAAPTNVEAAVGLGWREGCVSGGKYFRTMIADVS